jgi:putative transposase
MEFIETWTHEDHVHFLIQGIPRMSPSEKLNIVKSIVARKISRSDPEDKTM